MSKTRNWSRQSLDELVATYQTEIHGEFEASEQADERAYPTAAWMNDRGYSGLRYALREHHDRTLAEFLQEDVGLGVNDVDHDSGRRCSIRDERTHEVVDAYFSRAESRGLLAESTLESRESRFGRWVRTYRDLHGDDALVTHASDPTEEATERERARSVLDRITQDLGTDASRQAFLSDVRAVYSYLVEEALIQFNPLRAAEKRYDWDTEFDNPALDARDVSRLVDAADGTRETILVTALAGWGLRTNEVAALHVNQLELDGDDPHIYFGEDRKNGASTVAIIHGRDAADRRIHELATEREDWTGYLFPSTQSASGHVTADTVRSWFADLADRSGVTVAAETPTPKMGRRFWYSSFSSAMSEVMASLEPVAEAQGAESVRVIWDNYLDEDERRDRRREAMRGRLEVAFDG